MLLILLAACPKPTATQGEGEPGPPASLATVEARAKAEVEPVPQIDAPTLTLVGARVMTAAGAIHEPGWLILEGGRIKAVGAGEPEQRVGTVLDLKGKTVTPGLIDVHSHIGVYSAPGANAHNDGNEATAPTRGDVWAESAFNPQDPNLQLALQGGVTTIQVLPGSANLVGGRGVVLHTPPARGARAMRFPGAPETVKMACGENPKRVYGEKGGPSTRMGNVAGYRDTFAAAERYQRAWADYAEAWAKWSEGGEGEEPKPPERDLENETLVGVLEGEMLVQFHCYRAEDMLAVLQVAEEFDFEIRAFHHALEAYKIRDVLAAKHIAVATWADWWGFKMEAYDGIPYSAGLLHEAGVTTVIKSDSPVDVQRLNQEAAKAMRYAREAGVTISEDQALRWITANAAWTVGIETEAGTLEAGKRADLVIWDGSPFSAYTHVEQVFVDGVQRYDRSAPPQTWSDFVIGQELQ